MGEKDDPEERYIAAAIHSAVTPREFEALVARLYEQQGYTTDLQPKGADQGVDFIASTALKEVAVQVKRYDPDRSRVGSPVVRETIGSAKAAGADDAHIVTSSLFTSPAEEAAGNVERMEVRLVDGVELVELLHEHGVAVEEADSEIIASATAAGSGTAFTGALQSQLRDDGSRQSEIEAALTRYCRKQLAENQEEIEAKVQELGGYLVANAREVDWSERGKQVRTRLGERSGAVSDRLGGVRDGAAERAGLVRDKSGALSERAGDRARGVGEQAAERAADAKERAGESAAEAKEKASETKEKASKKASDLKDRFL